MLLVCTRTINRLRMYPLRSLIFRLPSPRSSVTTTHKLTSMMISRRPFPLSVLHLHMVVLNLINPTSDSLNRGRCIIWRRPRESGVHSPQEVLEVWVSGLHLEIRTYKCKWWGHRPPSRWSKISTQCHLGDVNDGHYFLCIGRIWLSIGLRAHVNLGHLVSINPHSYNRPRGHHHLLPQGGHLIRSHNDSPHNLLYF